METCAVNHGLRTDCRCPVVRSGRKEKSYSKAEYESCSKAEYESCSKAEYESYSKAEYDFSKAEYDFRQ